MNQNLVERVEKAESDNGRLLDMMRVLPLWLQSASSAPESYSKCYLQRLTIPEDELRLCQRLEARTPPVPLRQWDEWLEERGRALTVLRPIAKAFEPYKTFSPYLYDKCVRHAEELTPLQVSACNFIGERLENGKFLSRTWTSPETPTTLYSLLWERHATWDQMEADAAHIKRRLVQTPTEPRIPFRQLWMKAGKSTGPIWKKCQESAIPIVTKASPPHHSRTCENIEAAIHTGDLAVVMKQAQHGPVFGVYDTVEMEKYLLAAFQAARQIRSTPDAADSSTPGGWLSWIRGRRK